MAQRRIAIIGSGFSGLCLGIQLKKAGIDPFTIFEKSDRLGGTWRDNTYPGAACDVPSFLYCFSFEQKTDWSRKWSPQAEIRGARFDAEAGVWRLRTTGGEEIVADVMVSAVGQLNRPSIPDIPGLDRFRGACFHSARWDHAHDLAGKRVGVIGNAASAIQFIPQIAPKVRHLSIFQRSANWMLPRGDRAYTERERRWLTRFPLLARLHRWSIWLRLELRFPMIRGNRFFAWMARRAAEQNLRDHVADPRLRAALTPDYPIGGKRVLISDDYYPTLARDNVEVVTDRVARLTEDAVVTRDGGVHPVDALILATGFQTTAFLAPMRIAGLDGRSLDAEWADGARVSRHRGVGVPEPLPDVRPQHQPRPQLDHLHDRVPDAIHRRSDPHVDRARPGLPRAPAVGDG